MTAPSSPLARSLERALAVVLALALLLALAEWVLFPLDGRAGVLLALLPAVFLVYVVAGVVAWRRRPGNPLGSLILLAGVAVLLGSIQNSDVPVFEVVGTLCATLPVAAIGHLLLAFPGGRLTPAARVLVVGLYAVTLVPNALLLLTGPQAVIGAVQTAVAAVLTAAAVALLGARVMRADAATRRVLLPVSLYGLLALAMIPVSALVFERLLGMDPVARGLLQFAVLAGVPVAFAVGLLRGGFARTGEPAELGAWLGEGESGADAVEAALARALGDPSLLLALRRSDAPGYVDVAGREIDVPRPSRGWQPLALGGSEIAGVDYDATLLPAPEPVRAAGAVTALAIERERLNAELRAGQRALQRSRERLVEAADRERRRIARDLHDGLQARLVLIGVAAQRLADGGDGSQREQATRLRQDVDAAAADLRAIVQALMPSALVERGLAAAVEDLADRMPFPARLRVGELGAMDAVAESTAYFVVAEALTNAAKHARADRVEVSLERRHDHIVVRIADDGAGGADDAGRGLRGLRDRVEAIGGEVTVDSVQGEGTALWARIPSGS